MYIVSDSEKLVYELANIVKLFFPSEQVKGLPTTELMEDDNLLIPKVSLSPDKKNYELKLILKEGGESHRESSCNTDADDSIELGKLLYDILQERTHKHLPWGVLTGIRPVKIARKMHDSGMTGEEIEKRFCDYYLTEPKKARLCRITEENQREIVNSSLPKGFSLYISIPFCPSRCSFCSFVSHSVEKTRKLIPEYVEALCKEIVHTAELSKKAGLTLQSIYMGGGTPTTLSAQQMEQVLSTVNKNFNTSNIKEFTVEAGRPDTITADKLRVIKDMGADRISVNCQTLNDAVLEEIGRKHTAKQFYEAYDLASKYGFSSINVDLIAGLPTESKESFMDTCKKVAALNPDNITVHSLTLKKAARLQLTKAVFDSTVFDEKSPVSEMVDFSQEYIMNAGYIPYYMYRQKGTLDLLENVGFSKKGKEGYYNVYIMDETHSILSVGAGGVTKLVFPSETGDRDRCRIERVFNLKYPYEYLERFEQELTKKEAILLLNE